jgi:hypothetical protein
MLAVSTASDLDNGRTTDNHAVQAYVRAYPPSAAAATREETVIQVMVDDFDRRALENKDSTFWAPDVDAKWRNSYTKEDE